MTRNRQAIRALIMTLPVLAAGGWLAKTYLETARDRAGAAGASQAARSAPPTTQRWSFGVAPQDFGGRSCASILGLRGAARAGPIKAGVTSCMAFFRERHREINEDPGAFPRAPALALCEALEAGDAEASLASAARPGGLWEVLNRVPETGGGELGFADNRGATVQALLNLVHLKRYGDPAFSRRVYRAVILLAGAVGGDEGNGYLAAALQRRAEAVMFLTAEERAMLADRAQRTYDLGAAHAGRVNTRGALLLRDVMDRKTWSRQEVAAFIETVESSWGQVHRSDGAVRYACAILNLVDTAALQAGERDVDEDIGKLVARLRSTEDDEAVRRYLEMVVTERHPLPSRSPIRVVDEVVIRNARGG